MTAREARELLPSVRAIYQRRAYHATVSGRANPMATVTLHECIDAGLQLGLASGMSFPFSWPTIARAASNDLYLACD